MAESALQQLVDDLSEELGRPILVDDPYLVPLAYSSQRGPMDRVREESILARSVPGSVRDALLEQGIEHALHPVRTSADPAIGLAPRVCAPVRSGTALLGYVWVLDDGADDDMLERLADVAAQIADMLDQGAGWRADAARTLVGPDVDAAEAAGRRLGAQGLRLAGARPLVVAPEPSGADAIEWIESGLVALERHAGRAVLWGAAAGHHVVIVLDGSLNQPMRASPSGLWLQRELAESPLRPVGVRALVALGPPCASVAELHVAHRRARKALVVARAGMLGDVVDWTELGPLQLLAQLDPAALNDLPVELMRLEEDDQSLYETLERYLDSGGDVQQTSRALGIHRGTLYHRLKRIEELTGCSLGDGQDRLWLHLALKARPLLQARPS